MQRKSEVVLKQKLAELEQGLSNARDPILRHLYGDAIELTKESAKLQKLLIAKIQRDSDSQISLLTSQAKQAEKKLSRLRNEQAKLRDEINRATDPALKSGLENLEILKNMEITQAEAEIIHADLMPYLVDLRYAPLREFAASLTTQIWSQDQTNFSIEAIKKAFLFAVGVTPAGPYVDLAQKLQQLATHRKTTVRDASNLLLYLQAYRLSLQVWLRAACARL